MKKQILLVLIFCVSTAQAYFVYDSSPSIDSIIQECNTPSVKHVGFIDPIKLYSEYKFWNLIKLTPLEVMHKNFYSWHSANSFDDPMLLNIAAFGSTSDMLKRVVKENKLCIVMDWTSKNYYIFITPDYAIK